MLPLLPISKVKSISSRNLTEPHKVPLIPPKPQYFDLDLPLDHDKSAKWFIVQTPREIKGVGGPFTIDQMKNFYRQGDIDDTTLVWEENSEDNWIQLRYHNELRGKLIQFPPIPSKVSYHVDDSAKEGGLETTSLNGKVDLLGFQPENYCSACGGIAITNLPHAGEQDPDISTLSTLVGSTELASEVLPGFLFIGNFASSKMNSLTKLKIKLSINCTSEMPNSQEIPSYCRLKTFPLHDRPKKEHPSNMEMMLERLDHVCNWIDYERLYPDRISNTKHHHQESIQKTKIAANKLKSHSDQPTYSQLTRSSSNYQPIQKESGTRILLWSKIGFDRSCFVGVAYIVRRYGVTLSRAMDIVKKARPQMELSPLYVNILEIWSGRRTLGKLLCYDCIHSSMQLHSDIPKTKEEEDQMLYEPLIKLLASKPELQQIANPKHYVTKVLTGYTIASPWTGLCDLKLTAQSLGDECVLALLESLHQLSRLASLQCVDISGNKLHDQTVIHFMNMWISSEAVVEIMHLNISQNM
jgi:hypothetical protein